MRRLELVGVGSMGEYGDEVEKGVVGDLGGGYE